MNPTKRVRILKTLVQPVFVIDDGESLEEVNIQPLSVKGKDIDSVGAKVEEMREKLEAQLGQGAEVLAFSQAGPIEQPEGDEEIQEPGDETDDNPEQEPKEA